MYNVAQLLERAASRFPDRPALEDGGGEVSYALLRERSRSAASALLRLGLDRRCPVAVFLPKSASAVVVFYAALYCGLPYAPLDYDAPEGRLRATLDNLRPGCVVTDGKGAAVLPETGCPVLLLDELAGDGGEAVDRAAEAVTDQDPAYIMYTSGSTGTPKGVIIPHRGVLDYAAWIAETFSLSERSVTGLQSGFHFDNSVFDLYAAAACGAKVAVIPEILFRYPGKLLAYLEEKAVTCIFWVPTVMISTANCGALDEVQLPQLETVVFAGEVMPNKQLNVWRRAMPGRVFANLYGPTEVTVDCTCYMVDREFADSDPLPIGYERPNMRVLVLREDGGEAAPGETGELCVLGSQLALGYWNNPEETARAFVDNPLNAAYPERMYRTGDLASRDADGLLWFQGRRDSQIKLRGNRIELGDVENAARGVPGVQNAAALFDAENERIVLFLETAREIPLRRFNVELGKHLPRYMLPGRLVCMEALPLNANRKIDRVLLRTML